jgi:hypothetical protein
VTQRFLISLVLSLLISSGMFARAQAQESPKFNGMRTGMLNGFVYPAGGMGMQGSLPGFGIGGPIGIGADIKIVPMPSGSRGGDRIEVLHDMINAEDDEYELVALELREFNRALASAVALRSKLSGEALAKHEAEYIVPYTARKIALQAELSNLEKVIAELEASLRKVEKSLSASQGYLVMSPDDRNQAMTNGFNCGDGEQNVKRINSATEYACLTSEGLLVKSAVILNAKLANETAFVREDGKLVRIVTANEGMKMSEITYGGEKPEVKIFAKDGAEVSSCKVSPKNPRFSSGPDCPDCTNKPGTKR